MTDAAPSAPGAPTPAQASPNPVNETQTGQPNAGKEADIPEWKKQKHKYKAAGQEYEVDYDELVRRAEKGHGAEKRLAEAAKLEKEVKGRLERLKDPQAEDFNELIELIGFDKAKKFADKLVWDQIQWEELPEHEKRARLAQQRADEAERRLQDMDEKSKKTEQQRMVQQAQQVITDEVRQVLDEGRKQGLSVADIPEAEELIYDEMLAYLEYVDREEAAGRPVRHSPPSHADVLRKIQERYDQRSDAYLKRLSVEQLMKVLSKEQLAKLRQAEIDQLYAPIQSPGRSNKNQRQSDQASERPSKKAQRVMRTEDYFKKMDERYGG